MEFFLRNIKTERKYIKDYFENFIPITEYENKVFENHKHLKVLICNGTLFVIAASSFPMMLFLKDVPNTNPILGRSKKIIGFFIFALLGKKLGNVLSNKYIYYDSAFIRQRIFYELQNEFSREENFDITKDTLLKEYPFVDPEKGVMGDFELREMLGNHKNRRIVQKEYINNWLDKKLEIIKIKKNSDTQINNDSNMEQNTEITSNTNDDLNDDQSKKK